MLFKIFMSNLCYFSWSSKADFTVDFWEMNGGNAGHVFSDCLTSFIPHVQCKDYDGYKKIWNKVLGLRILPGSIWWIAGIGISSRKCGCTKEKEIGPTGHKPWKLGRLYGSVGRSEFSSGLIYQVSWLICSATISLAPDSCSKIKASPQYSSS